MAALVIAHGAANRCFFALARYAASHNVSAQFYSGTLERDESGKSGRDPTLHVVSAQAVNTVTDLVRSGPTVRAGYSEPGVVFPLISRIGGVQVAVEHERRPVTLAAHNGDNVSASFFLLLADAPRCRLHAYTRKENERTPTPRLPGSEYPRAA